MTHGWKVEKFGGLDAMAWVPIDVPSPGPGQVRVKVAASGINFAETRMREGTYGGQTAPFVLGMESAGTVESIGAGVSGFGVGDRVFGRARGSHATHVIFDAAHLMHVPENLSFEQAAAIPVGWQTAWHALHTVAKVRPGQRVLIEAVASSVGSAALQIAKQMGCWVAGTASRDEKLAIAKQWGCDATYNYKTIDLAAAVAKDTNGLGIEIGLMTIGEETATALLDSMGVDGQVVMYGSTGGRHVTFNLNIGTRNLQLKAMSISTNRAFLEETMVTFKSGALRLFDSGILKPVVSDVLPMKELAKAHLMVSDRRHFGKVIMKNEG
jgi:NADPH2:quinone reductase